MEKEKPHLSPSQLNSYFRCGEAYRRRYIEKQIIPPAFAMLKGGAVHVAAEENFKQKIETHEDLSVKQIVECAAAAFEGKIKAEGVLLSEEERTRGQKIVKGEFLDSTVTSATILATDVCPKRQPTAVEEKVRLELPESPYDLLGVLDLILPDGIQDLKNTGKKLGQTDIDGNPQFTTYAALYYAKFKKPALRIIVDNIIHRPGSKQAADYQELMTERTKPDFDALAARINAAIKGILAGVFTPATPGAWWCSKKSCGFFASCKFTREGNI